MGLLKNVMRLSMTSLKGADAKDISSSVTAIANEKIKAEKEAAAGKKKQGNNSWALGALFFVLFYFKGRSSNQYIITDTLNGILSCRSQKEATPHRERRR